MQNFTEQKCYATHQKKKTEYTTVKAEWRWLQVMGHSDIWDRYGWLCFFSDFRMLVVVRGNEQYIFLGRMETEKKNKIIEGNWIMNGKTIEAWLSNEWKIPVYFLNNINTMKKNFAYVHNGPAISKNFAAHAF